MDEWQGLLQRMLYSECKQTFEQDTFFGGNVSFPVPLN